jgi:hypothetical protein
LALALSSAALLQRCSALLQTLLQKQRCAALRSAAAKVSVEQNS